MLVPLRLRGEGGAIAILVAIFALLMFGLAAIVVDLGMVRVTKADSRAAADSAALAGAAALYRDDGTGPWFDDAIAAVKASASGNGTANGDWGSCFATPPSPSWVAASSATSCIMFDSSSSPRRVFVAIPARHVDAAFGGVFGYSGSDVTASAQAQARDRSVQDCSLCIDNLLTVDGRVTVDGDGSAAAGQIEVNDGGRLELTPGAMQAGGGIGAETWPPSPAPPSTRYSPQPDQFGPADPFAGTARPLLPVNPISNVRCGDGQSLATGVAYRVVRITGDCQVSSGTVFITQRLLVDAGMTLTGSDAMLYFTCRGGSPAMAVNCDSSASGGRLQVFDGGTLNLTGGQFVGGRPFAIWFDPDNSEVLEITGSLTVGGANVYKPAGRMAVDGSTTVDGLVAVDDLSIGSAGTFDLTANGLGSQPGAFRVALVK